LGYSVADDIRQHKLSEEIRLASRIGSSFDWRLGGFYTREKGSIAESVPTFDPLTGVPVPISLVILNALTPSTFNEYAAFAEATYHFTGRFDLTGGLRYSHNHQDIVQIFSGLLTGLVDTNSPSSDSATTFLVTPRFKLTDNTMLYGRVASGYRPGGPNFPTVPPTPPVYGPDRDVNYEVGVKALFPDQRLSFDAAIFYVDWTKIQLNVVTPSGLQYTANAGSASSRGAEVAVNYSPVTALTFAGALSYTNAQLEKGLPSGAVGAKGDRLPYSPRFKANLSAEYAHGTVNGWAPYLGATYLFNGSELIDFSSDSSFPRIELPAYRTIGARTGIRNKRWTIEVYAKNISDVRGYDSAAGLAGSPTGPYALGVIQPRTIGFSVIATF
jgi:iron complex outermembrane receptor protein